MPKIGKQTTTEILSQILKDKTYRGCYEAVNNKSLHCTCCDIVIDVERDRLKERAASHSKSDKHQTRIKGQRQPSATTAFEKQKQTRSENEKLVEAMIAADIPISKLENPRLRSVLGAKFGTIPSQGTIRQKIIPSLYDEKLNSLKERFSGQPVALILDETRDSVGRNVNILCGILDGEKYDMRLVDVSFIERTDSTHVSQAFVRTINKLNISFDDVWLVVTDHAAYMVKCFRDLKTLFPKLHHVSCLAHAIHRVCEKVRENHKLVDDFLGKMRVVFSRSNDRTQFWKDITGLILPPKPVLTRWGTWINAAVFYAENFEKTKEFIEKLAESTKKIGELKQLLEKPELKEQMSSVHDFKFLPMFITLLEEKGLRVEQQLEHVSTLLSSLKGEYLLKFEKCLEKNPDYKKFTKNDEIEFKVKTKFAHLVSVDVERSFSVFKAFFRSNRQSFTEINIEKHMIIMCNSDI